MQQPRQSFEDESGSEFVEWTVVLAILVLATYAILQAIGGEFSGLSSAMLQVVRQALIR